MNSKSILLFAGILLSACGGSDGDGADSKVFEGQLTQGSAVDHAARLVKHGENEPIEDVKICALGRCSTTDGQGMFGFSAPENFKGGEVLVSVDGHGILAETVVNIPNSGKNIFIHLESSTKTEVHLHHLMVDGTEVDSGEVDHHG